jgi:nucleoid DNA-binding protein
MAAKKPARKTPAKKSASNKPATKTEVLSFISENTAIHKKIVGTILGSLTTMIGKEIGKRGPGVFTIPGLCKIKVVLKPARKARKGVNPFTGEAMMFKAKPAKKVVKVLPLQGLKNMV